MDVDALAKKILAVMGQTNESVLAAGSLAAAAYILSGDSSALEDDPEPQPVRRQSRQALRAPVAPHVPPSLSNPNGLDVASLAQQLALRMRANDPNRGNDQGQGVVESDPSDQPSLVDKWAGPLPSLNGKSKKSRPAPAVAAPAKKTKIPVAPPDAVCPQCQDPINSHPKAKNVRSDSQNRPCYVICDGRFVYCERSHEEGPDEA